METIVNIILVCGVTGQQLYDYTTEIISYIQKLGVKVLTITTDNHKINLKMFRLFFQPDFKFSNPDFHDQSMYDVL